jgi:hypothetical protein
MRVLLLLLLIAACANQPIAPEVLPPKREEKVPEVPVKKPVPQKPTVIVVPTPPPIPKCAPPAKSEKQQILQDLDCLYQLERTKPK